MKTILFVDDESELLEMYRSFADDDLKVLTTDSGDAALALLRETHVDVVFSDINMTNGNGLELLDSLHVIDGPPVVLVSGFSDISNSEVIERGAKGLLPKPLEKETVKAIMLELFNT